MLQITLPFGGDELNLQIQETVRKLNINSIQSYLKDFMTASTRELNWVDPNSGIRKLKNVGLQSEAYLPWVVASYANFYLHSQKYQLREYMLVFPEESKDMIAELLVEIPTKVDIIGNELFAAFLLLGTKRLVEISGAKDFIITTRDWYFLTPNQVIRLLNPLTDTHIEFIAVEPTYIKLEIDLHREVAYVFTSSSLSQLAALHLDLRHGSGITHVTDTFLKQSPQNRYFMLDTDNLVSSFTA